MTRLFLAVYAVLYLAFGVYALLQPEALATLLGSPAMGGSGLYELRSNYGGVSLGAGTICLFGALRSTLQAPGLWFVLAYMGGYASGRIFALFSGERPAELLLAFGGFEAVTALVAAWLLWRRPAVLPDHSRT